MGTCVLCDFHRLIGGYFRFCCSCSCRPPEITVSHILFDDATTLKMSYIFFCRKLSNYFIWKLARRYAQELSWDFIHANRIFYNDVTGRENFWGTWKHCFYHAKYDMVSALGSLYAKQHFKDKNKSKVYTH